MSYTGLTNKRMDSGRPVIAIALLLILALAGCGQRAERAETAEAPRNVRVLTLTPGDLNEYLTIYGPAAPLRGTVLNAEESGQVRSVVNDKGARVAEGDAIVVLDRDLIAAELRSAEAQLELASFNAAKTKKLFDENSISEIEWLNAKTQESLARAALEAAKLRHDRAATVAPFAGVVANRYVELGEMVNPGQPVARVVDPYTLKLESSVTETEVGLLREGARATVAFESSDATVEGVVHWVGFEADPQTGKFPVEIRIDNADLALRPGIIAHARILKQVHADVIRIPRDAVVQRAGGPVAFVEENGVARRRPLTLGIDQGFMVVVDSGLEAGDRLLVRGQRDVRDGVAVAVREQSDAADGSTAADPAAARARGARDGESEGTSR